MAEAVAAVLWEIGAAWATDAAVFALSNAAVINAAVAITASSAYGAQQKRKARAAYNASLKDREVMARSGVMPRRIIYGRDKVSGPVVYAESTGAKGEYLHLVIALAAHECDAIEEIWFNDVLLPTPDGSGNINSGPFAKTTANLEGETLTSNAGGAVTLAHSAARVIVITRPIVGNELASEPVTGWAHTPGTALVTGLPVSEANLTVNYEWESAESFVRIKKHLGQVGQVADADLVSESAGKWTSAHVGDGTCYLYVRLQYDQDVFGQVGLPNISAVVRGRKVNDPRVPAAGWTDNAALCVADWLAQSYGLGAATGEVPSAEVIAAANICDETITLNLAGSLTQKRYTFSGSFTTDVSPRDVLADMLTGLAGSCVWTQGRWLVRAGSYRAPSMTVTADHLGGRGVGIMPKVSRSDLFNAVRITYRDPSQKWAEAQAPLVTNATYEAQDGGIRLVRSIQLPGVMDAWRAQRLGKIELERARQSVTVSLTGNMRMYDLAPTDTVALTLDRYGWAGKVFEIIERTWAPDGVLPYTMRETASAVWAWNYGEATAVDPAPDTDLPSPYDAPATLTGLAVASGTSHLLRLSDGTIIARAWVTWAPSVEAFVFSGGRIEIEWRRADAQDWQSTPALPGDADSAYIAPMPDEQVVLIRARAGNSSGRVGAWATISATIAGKSAPPGNVAGITATPVATAVNIKWTANTEADYAVTRLTYGASYASSVFLWEGTGSDVNVRFASDGTYTVWAVHVDTSGNKSATPASVSAVYSSSSGTGAPVLQLTATGFAFVFANSAAVSSASPTITFTAVPQNLAGTATFTATARDAANASLGTITLGGSGNTRTLTAAQFVSLGATTTRRIEVSATLGGITDYATVYRGDDGSNAINLVLGNQAHVAPTASDGTGGSFGGATTTVRIFEGITDVTALWSTAIVASSCTATINGGAGPVTGTGSVTVAVSAMSADAATVAITATRSGYPTQADTFSLAKSRAGVVGGTGPTGPAGTRTARLEMYQWASSTPTTFPGGAASTYTWATGLFTAPGTTNGWAINAGAGSPGQTRYACTQLYSDTGTSSTSNVTWTTTTAYVVGYAGTNGSTGGTGTRGSLDLYITGTSPLTSAECDAAVLAQTGSSTKVLGDTVTESGAAYVSSLRWNGSAWVSPGLVIDGNLIVSNSILASSINVNGLSLRDTSGGPIILAGSSLTTSTLNVPGTVTNVPAGWLNSNVTPASLGVIKTDLSNAPAGAINNNVDFAVGTLVGWTNIASVTADQSASGGYYGAMQTAGQPVYPAKRPVDPSRVYQLRVRLFRPTSGGAFDVGMMCFDQTGAEMTGSGSMLRVTAAVAGETMTAGQWITYEAVVTGTQALSGTDRNKFFTGTAGVQDISYAAPYVITGAGWGGGLQVDFAELLDITSQWSAAPQVVVQGGSMAVGPGYAAKTSNGGGVDAGVRSLIGYVGGCSVTWVPRQANKWFSVGLNTDPTSAADESSIDFGMRCHFNGDLYYFESGSGAVLTTYLTGDALQITYDGVNVRYLKNGAVLRTVAASVSTALYLDSTFRDQGALCGGLKFEALSNVYIPVASIGLAKIDVASITSLSALSANLGMATAGSLDTTGYVVANGNSTLSVTLPVSLSSASKTVAISGNVGGSSQVGIVGMSASVSGYGVYAHNSASNPALVAVQTGAASGAIQAHSQNGYGVQAFGATYGAVCSANASNGIGLGGSATGAAGIGVDAIGGAYGVRASGASYGVSAVASAAAGTGVLGSASNASGVGIEATHTGGGLALWITGKLRIEQTAVTGSAIATFVGTNKPGAATSQQWVPVNINGTAGHIPWWPDA